jgi:hypothetical protein
VFHEIFSIARHCISCLFPKFELSCRCINYSKGRPKEKHVYASSILGECPMLRKNCCDGPIKEVLKQSPGEGKGGRDDQMGKVE